MKKGINILMFVVLAAVCLVASCEQSNGNDGGGILTIIDIPSEYNGKYAYYVGLETPMLLGAAGMDLTTGIISLVQINDGTVKLPMWIMTNNGYRRFSGDRTVKDDDNMVSIFNTSKANPDSPTFIYDLLGGISFESISFRKGNATISWNDGE